MPNVELLFGPLLIGVYLNTILYGILLVQSFIYYRTYRKDPPRLRYFILFLVICDTLNTIFDIGVMYEPLVSRYGTPRATERIPIMLYVDPIMTVIISTSVQLYICWRIQKITSSWIIPGFISFFIFCSLVGGVATSICSSILVNFSQLENFKGAVITWLASSAIADICITTSLVISLARRRTTSSSKKTNDAIDRIIRLTIHTGAVTALFATMDLVLFVAVPGTSLNFAFDFPLAKLYTNSLLSTLNARGGWHTMAQQPQDNVLFGPSSWNSGNNSNNRKIDHQSRYGMYGKKTTTTPDTDSDVIVLSRVSQNTSSQTRHEHQRGQDFDIDLEMNGGNTAPKMDVTTNESIASFNIPAV